jgi:hypothetical protein
MRRAETGERGGGWTDLMALWRREKSEEERKRPYRWAVTGPGYSACGVRPYHCSSSPMQKELLAGGTVTVGMKPVRLLWYEPSVLITFLVARWRVGGVRAPLSSVRHSRVQCSPLLLSRLCTYTHNTYTFAVFYKTKNTKMRSIKVIQDVPASWGMIMLAITSSILRPGTPGTFAQAA